MDFGSGSLSAAGAGGMRLQYSPQAIGDLQKLQRYIAEILQNPTAAKRTVRRILAECARLKEFPEMGCSIQEKTGHATDLRMLICGNCLAVYRIQEETISVIRVLNARQDYIRILFG